jgi:hypothetical protein
MNYSGSYDRLRAIDQSTSSKLTEYNLKQYFGWNLKVSDDNVL